MIPVVELLRVSTALQAQNLGLPAQHAVNEQTCSRFGLHVVATIEIVESGTESARTLQMGRLLELVASGSARGIVLAEYSRLFRPDRWTDLGILQTFADHDAKIYLPSGPLDLQSEGGFVQATVYNLGAALERRRIRERLQRGKEQLRRRGENVHPIAVPFGVNYTREHGWSYNADIERVKEVFRLFLEGERNMEEIGRQVGIARTSALYILQNPIYTGWRVYDKKRDQSPAGKFEGKGYRKTTSRDADEIIRVRLPLTPIVSDFDFNVVQQLLAAHRRRQPRRVADPLRYLYRGHADCGDCAQPLYGIIASSAKKPYYVCKSHTARRPAGGEKCGNVFMDAEKLEHALDVATTDQLCDPNVIVSAVEEYNDSVLAAWRAMRPSAENVEARIEELSRRRARVVEAFIDGAIDRGNRDERLRAIDTEIAAVGELGADKRRAEPEIITPDQVTLLVQSFAEWAHLDRAAKRGMLEALRCTFYVARYDVRGVEFPIGSDSVSPSRKTDVVATGNNQFIRKSSGLYVPLCA